MDNCWSCGYTKIIDDATWTGKPVCHACYHHLFGKPYPGKQNHDPINSPPHYIFGPYELRAVLDEWVDTMDIPKSEACDWFSMMQYLFRYPRKGKPARDLDKAMRYLKWIRERYD